MGAFLEWGLEKDLFLPFKEQTRKVKEGDRFPVALYVDKSGRLCATMKVYHYLRTDSPYHKDDRVSGCLYEISRQFGAFVAVDNQYSALIPPKEMYGELKVGDHVEARVVRVHEDGKLDLSVREKAYLQVETDAEKVMKLIDSVYSQPKGNVVSSAMAWMYFLVVILILAVVAAIMSAFVFYQKKD